MNNLITNAVRSFRLVQLKRKLLFALFLFVMLTGKGQDERYVPANYAGILAGIEWNTISGLTGIEYERTLFSRRHITAGLKASYIFKYKTGNMQLFNRPCCPVNKMAVALATAGYFTAKKGYPSGFFLHGGLGVGLKTSEFEQSRDLVHVRPAFEAGAGWLFLIGNRLGLKWTNTISFPSRDGGITITRLAFGF